jgi:hypothetical protein
MSPILGNDWMIISGTIRKANVKPLLEVLVPNNLKYWTNEHSHRIQLTRLTNMILLDTLSL